MNIQDAFNGLVETTKQSALSIVTGLKPLRNDPEFFEKVCQVAVASLQLIMMRYPGAANLARLSFALNTALMHDFYNFLKQPYQWMFPVCVDLIDENALLKSLTDTLQTQLDPTYANVQEVEDLAKECLEHRLKSMRDSSDAYSSVDVFKDVLTRQLRNTSYTPFVLTDVKLDDLKVNLRHVPMGERLANLTWTICDIGCVGLFLHEWKLLDTAQWAESIGQIPGFQWVKNTSFETSVIGFVATAFGLKLYEAARKLQYEALTEEERRDERWKVVTATAELVLFGSMFLNRIGQTAIPQSMVYSLAIFAKSLGLISIATRPAHQFFQPKTAPAA